MKKNLKVIIGIISSLLCLIVVFCVTIFICFSDYSSINDENVINNKKETSIIINNNLQKGAKDVNETNNVSFTLDELDLEYILFPIINNISLNDNVKLTGVNVDVVDEKYTLQVSGSFYLFSSVITANIDMNYINECFIISLNQFKVAKVGLYPILKNLLKVVDANNIKEKLEKVNIYCDLDFNNFSISFSKDNIKSMLNSLTNDDSIGSFYTVLSDILLSDESLMSFSFGKDNLLGVTIKLASLKNDKNVFYSYDFISVKNNVELLLKNNIITLNQVNPSFNFLVNGYDRITDIHKEIIDTIDYSSIGINDNKSYKGILLINDKSLSSYINEMILLSSSDIIINNGIDIKISELIINDVIKSSVEIIGTSYAFACEESNEIGYFLLEQINFICLENKVIIDIIANINDYQFYIEASLNTDETSKGLSLITHVDYIKIGDKTLTDLQRNYVLNFLSSALSNVDWINVDSTINTINLDFSKCIIENDIIANIVSLISNYKFETSVHLGYVNVEFIIVS